GGRGRAPADQRPRDAGREREAERKADEDAEQRSTRAVARRGGGTAVRPRRGFLHQGHISSGASMPSSARPFRSTSPVATTSARRASRTFPSSTRKRSAL